MQELFLKRIKVRNFKSFADMDLELERLNVVVGANAAGKSNLVSMFGFLRDLCKSGLDGAVSAQGGPRCIANPKLAGQSTVVELEVKAPKTRVRIPGRRKVYSTGGRWRLEFRAGGEKAELIEDSWAFDVCEQRTQARPVPGDWRDRPEYSNADREGTVNSTRNGGRLRLETDLGGCLGGELGRCAASGAGDKLLVESGLLGGLFPWLTRFEDIGVCDFSGTAGLSPPGSPEPDGGSCLALRRALADGESRKRLHALVSDMLPFVKSMGAEDFAKSVALAAAGKRTGKAQLPASPLSGGTVSAAAVVASMYFGDMPVVAIEEPENSMHPSLMAWMTEMARDASRDRQIVMTTHSPELIRHAGAESLYAIQKDSGGFSEICRPSANKEIAPFLENGVGVAEMHVMNMLEW